MPKVSRAAELLRQDYHSVWEIKARAVHRRWVWREEESIATVSLHGRAFGPRQDDTWPSFEVTAPPRLAQAPIDYSLIYAVTPAKVTVE